MTNKELQEFLKQFPDDMPIKLMTRAYTPPFKVIDLTEENILHTSATARLIEAETDDDNDEVILGKGPQYLLFNPVIS